MAGRINPKPLAEMEREARANTSGNLEAIASSLSAPSPTEVPAVRSDDDLEARLAVMAAQLADLSGYVTLLAAE
jgi:hypothetical protein